MTDQSDPIQDSPTQFIIEPFLPTQEVHLLAGTSDAGKTRWLFSWLLEWQQGNAVVGCKSYPVPWVYVAGDRTERTANRTLLDMGIDPEKVPIIPAFGKDRKTKRQLMEAIAKSGARFAVIEAFQRYIEPPGLSYQVTAFLDEMSCYTEVSKDFPQGLTILGVVESPKLKPQERYQDARQRVSGVSAWGYYSSTVLLIERKDPTAADDPRRILYVCPKAGRRMEIEGSFNDGGMLHFDRKTPEIDLSKIASKSFGFSERCIRKGRVQ